MEYSELYNKYKKYNKNNVSYEEFVKLCYEMAEQYSDAEYAVNELKESAKYTNEFRYEYEHGHSVASVVYCTTL